jgi:hypothetical protein
MKRGLSLAMCLFSIWAVTSPSLAKDKAASDAEQRLQFGTWHDGLVRTSAGRFLASKLGPDTLAIYGGPGSLLGKFEDASHSIPQAQGWIGVDPTDQPTLWQQSTFNMANLNGHGAGNKGMWAGQTAAQQPGYVSAPGYGNSWNALIEYRRTVANPAVGQTVGLDFFFNYDTELAFDFFVVEYDSANATRTLYAASGTNGSGGGVFASPGVRYSTLSTPSITYAANSYSGPGNNEIVLRIRATSDVAWSDEDGLNPTFAGHSQIDDITVTSSAGVDFENFEGPGPIFKWNPVKGPYGGFFGKFFARVTDLDPCRDSATPVMAFVDDGTPPSNPTYVGPGTGGTTSLNWNYGVPGGWVVNYNGGVSLGVVSCRNEFWSPAIAFDLPGTDDDGPDFAGLQYQVSVYEHLPLTDGQFWQWHVRGSTDNGANWSPWASRNFVYFSGTPRWINNTGQVADLVPSGPTHVQFRLVWRDEAALFGFPGTDSTPSPFMDNFAAFKYRIGGPAFSTRTIDQFNDGFATNGSTDLSSQAARDAMDIRIDMARDVSSGTQNIPGDSMIVDIASVIPGVAITDSLTQIKMYYSLNMNPLFEAAIRGNAPVTNPGGGFNGWDQSEGVIAPTQAANSVGVPTPDRYAFDFPDEDFLYPGDILEYYIEAVDDDGRTTTFPADISGFDDLSTAFARTFTVRGLPTYTNTSGDTPDILLVNDFGRRGGENDYLAALGQNGLFEGIHFDSYTVMGPSSNVSNGIGSAGAHGATADQLRGYSCILYMNGDLNGNALSNGTAVGNNDKGNDQGVLSSWHDQNAPRAIVYFGDYLVSSVAASGGSGLTYLATIMGVDLNDNDVRDEIGGQTAPRVLPLHPSFTQDFVAFGGCLAINQFDSIEPNVGALRTHGFEQLGAPGSTYGGVAAGVVWDRLDMQGNRKVDITFPFGFEYVQNAVSKAAPSARTVLIEEILNYIGGHQPLPGPATPTDGAPKPALHVAGNFPNPFNPSTSFQYAIGVRGQVEVKVYNTRGELVRSVYRGIQDAGEHAVTWNGTDDAGRSVASGVYLYKVSANGFEQVNKMVLVK